MSISFFNKGGGGGGSIAPNVFCQLAEPTVKKGIWLQKNAKFEHIYGDDDVVNAESWYPSGTYRSLPSAYGYSAATVGTDIYFTCENGFYKFDTINNEYTYLNGWTSGYALASDPSSTDIYMFNQSSSNTYVYKYDTLTRTRSSQLNSYSGTLCEPIFINGSIYAHTNSNPSKFVKYDIISNTFTNLGNTPFLHNNSGGLAVIGNDLYYIGGSSNSSEAVKAYKYDTINNTWTSLANTPVNFTGGISTSYGNNIYIATQSSTSPALYKYNALTDTYTQLSNPPIGVYSNARAKVNNKWFVLGCANGDYKWQMNCMQIENKTYEDNSVVISQGRLYNVGYATEIFSNSLMEEPLLYAFADAWFYTTQNGLDGSMPVYYGDGTQWVNIKNPPA